ncbi:unnamed protein product [Effrenium voratum]|uniref:Uncharacterized protein n=1 Tax=Effrenium voratum TaxID=2562239 RepID=A0AA36JGQ0_9DINO|nr:unnamed protein product [Effrenium voratum]
MFRIPEPAEVLSMQAEGLRCVSALTSPQLLSQIFGHRDCLEMEKFVEAGRYWQQVGFFQFLQATAKEQLSCLNLGRRWELSWNYVSSDMNAVANHLLMTLKSQLMVAMARKTLVDAGQVLADGELATVRSDVYPRAA